MAFNQDATCFTCGLDYGFVVYNTDPPAERFSRIDTAGISKVEMLLRSNIFLLIGGGLQPKYPLNTLVIWDDFQKKSIAELEFAAPVCSARLRRDAIIVSTIEKTFVYAFSDLRLMYTFNTFANISGVIACNHGAKIVVGTLGPKSGQVVVRNISNNTEKCIQAHTSDIAMIALNNDGTLLATVSSRGTLIRIWDVETGEQIKELRRGTEPAIITNLVFDGPGTKLCVSSNKGTIHIFSLISSMEANKKSSLTLLSDYLPQYFSSEWSALSFVVNEPRVHCSFNNNGEQLYVIIEKGDSLVLNKYTISLKTQRIEVGESVTLQLPVRK